LANLAMDRGTGAAPPRSPGQVSDFRAAVKAVSGTAGTAAPAPSKSLRGLVKGGVVHLVEGELPEGIFVRVTPEGK
jgi:probable phosphoglycerate mutase